ncbi:putative protein N(5)-glutamine methyltransferase [Nocardia sp. NPDC003482]
MDIDALAARLRAAGCVFAEEEAELLAGAASSPGELEDLVAQRVSGVPLEYVLGWAEFHGLRVRVAPGVFVPRRRTEFLVDRAVALAAGLSHVVVLDLCCGTGALGLAVATELTAAGATVELTASDIDPTAVACARANLADITTSVFEGDLFTPLPTTLAGRVDLLLANTPYVPTAEVAHLPPEARDHEPRTALDGGPDGLDILRRVAASARPWLSPRGHLFVETSTTQAPSAAQILAAHTLTPHITHSETATIVTATL